MESAKGCIIIEPVSGIRDLCRIQQSNFIIVVQRPDADTGEIAHFFYGFHLRPSRQR